MPRLPLLRLRCLLLALVVPVTALPTQRPARAAAPDAITPALQRLADSLVAARPRLPGIVIAVRSRVLARSWSVAAGMSDSARRIPLRPEQPMRIASNTKTYVAAALLRLVEDKRLALSLDP
ncbi:MAG: serine hydrolase [Gemmatimonadota bacterium]